MKTLIATAALALSFAAPAAAADVSVKQFFALGNDSAAERIVGDSSQGNPFAAEVKFAMTNDSAAETSVLPLRERTADVDVMAIEQKFALTNDSAAERIVR